MLICKKVRRSPAGIDNTVCKIRFYNRNIFQCSISKNVNFANWRYLFSFVLVGGVGEEFKKLEGFETLIKRRVIFTRVLGWPGGSQDTLSVLVHLNN